MRLALATFTIVLVSAGLEAQTGAERPASCRVDDRLLDLSAEFPAGCGPIRRSPEPADDDRAPVRFHAEGDGGRLAAVALFPQAEGLDLTENPHDHLRAAAKGYLDGRPGALSEALTQWRDGTPSLEARGVLHGADDDAPDRFFRTLFVLYPRAVVLAEVSGPAGAEWPAGEVDRFFASVRRPGSRPPAAYRYRTRLFSLEYPAETRIRPQDETVVFEAVGGQSALLVAFEPGPPDPDGDLADLARLIGELAREGPLVEIERGPERVGAESHLVLLTDPGEGRRRHRLRFLPVPGGRLVLSGFEPADLPHSWLAGLIDSAVCPGSATSTRSATPEEPK